MAMIISFLNSKGGVAKTTSAVNTAWHAATTGRRVLLVDLDRQLNASALFGECRPKSDRLLPMATRRPRLHFMAPFLVADFPLQHDVIKAVQSVKDQYDLVILDCPYGLNEQTRTGLIMSNRVVVPLVAGKFGVDGLKAVMRDLQSLRADKKSRATILGVLPVMYHPRQTVSKFLLGELENITTVFKNRIPQSVKFEEAHLLKQTVFEYSPRSKAARSYEAFAEELLGML